MCMWWYESWGTDLGCINFWQGLCLEKSGWWTVSWYLSQSICFSVAVCLQLFRWEIGYKLCFSMILYISHGVYRYEPKSLGSFVVCLLWACSNHLSKIIILKKSQNRCTVHSTWHHLQSVVWGKNEGRIRSEDCLFCQKNWRYCAMKQNETGIKLYVVIFAVLNNHLGMTCQARNIIVLKFCSLQFLLLVIEVHESCPKNMKLAWYYRSICSSTQTAAKSFRLHDQSQVIFEYNSKLCPDSCPHTWMPLSAGDPLGAW